jgi:hypothetical protein
VFLLLAENHFSTAMIIQTTGHTLELFEPQHIHMLELAMTCKYGPKSMLRNCKATILSEHIYEGQQNGVEFSVLL